MSDKTKKTYVFIAGKHTDADGKKYVKNDKIELTEKEAAGLVNKIVDPESIGLTANIDITSLQVENSRLKERVSELELEIEQLKEGLEEE